MALFRKKSGKPKQGKETPSVAKETTPSSTSKPGTDTKKRRPLPLTIETRGA